MKLYRALATAVVLGGVFSPLAVFAQADDGSVTTAPASLIQSAPALGTPVLLLAVLVLVGLGARHIRTNGDRAVTGLFLAAGLISLAALSYATSGVVVEGQECNQRTQHAYPNKQPNTLTSRCSEDIKIVALDPGCVEEAGTDCLQSEPVVNPPCNLGQVLAEDDICDLPSCGCSGLLDSKTM